MVMVLIFTHYNFAEELLKLATLPGEECFDLTKRLSPDDLELIHEKSKDSRSKNVRSIIKFV